MKKLLIVLTLLTSMSFTALASNCLNAAGENIIGNPIEFVQLIKDAESCYDASELARSCAWGSLRDLSTVNTAYEKCSDSLNINNTSNKNRRLLKKMIKACSESDNGGGSLGRSISAYCNLSAIAFIVALVE